MPAKTKPVPYTVYSASHFAALADLIAPYSLTIVYPADSEHCAYTHTAYHDGTAGSIRAAQARADAAVRRWRRRHSTDLAR